MATRLLVLGAAAALLVPAAWTAAARPEAGARTVPCRESIDETAFPFIGSPGPARRYRSVLGAVSAPPVHLPNVEHTGQEPWPYWRKQGIVVRAGAGLVTVTVPKAWRSRVAIEWGNAGTGGPFSTVRFAGCQGDAGAGHAYAGGFVLRSPSACVPLVFHAGGRSTTLRFGIGRRC
jgi:hypothetical protein